MEEAGKAREIVNSTPETTDPVDFFTKFKSSTRYKQAYNKFYQGKKLSKDVSEKEKKKTFEDGDWICDPLIDFHKEELKFKYDPVELDETYPELQEALDSYVGYVFFLERTEGRSYLNREKIIERDKERRRRHVAVARTAYESGVAPTKKLGEALASIVLLNENLTTESEARKPTIKKIERQYK